MLNESPAQVRKDLKTIRSFDSEKECFNTLIGILRNRNYGDSIELVTELIKDNKLKFILGLGFGGKFADYKLRLTKRTIPVYSLIPTQSEIDLDATIKYFNADHVRNAFKDSCVIIRPIVTFNGTFIVDGHHRWSEIYALNRNAKVECVDITGNLSPLSMLKAVQCTLGSNLGKLKINTVDGNNLFKVPESYIEKKLDFINNDKELYDELSLHYRNPITEVTRNIVEMKNGNTPILNAPNRGEMPQTSKDPSLFKDLKKGITKV